MHGVDDVGDLIGGRHQPAPRPPLEKSRTNARTPPPPVELSESLFFASSFGYVVSSQEFQEHTLRPGFQTLLREHAWKRPWGTELEFEGLEPWGLLG